MPRSTNCSLNHVSISRYEILKKIKLRDLIRVHFFSKIVCVPSLYHYFIVTLLLFFIEDFMLNDKYSLVSTLDPIFQIYSIIYIMKLQKKRGIHGFIINSKITNSRSLHLSTHEEFHNCVHTHIHERRRRRRWGWSRVAISLRVIRHVVQFTWRR